MNKLYLCILLFMTAWPFSVEASPTLISGESCAQPLEAKPENNTTPVNTGNEKVSYWYKYILPRDGKVTVKFHTVNHGTVELYANCNQTYGAQALVGKKKGETIYLQATARLDFNYTWNINIEDDKTGDYCGFPTPIAAGNHTLPYQNLNGYWYSFIMPIDGKLVANKKTSNSMAVLKSCNTVAIASGKESLLAPGLKKGDNILIYHSYIGVNQSYDWSLNYEINGAGDVCESAAPASKGNNSILESDFDYYWYKYTMPADGKLLVSAGGNISPGFFLGECSDLTEVVSGRNSIMHPEFKEGQTVYIRWRNQKAAFSWNLAVEDLEEGDICENAAVAETNNRFSFSESSINSFWYTYTMPYDGNIRVKTISTGSIPQVNVYAYTDCKNKNLIGNGTRGLELTDLKAGQTVLLNWKSHYNDYGPTSVISWELKTFGPNSLCSLGTEANEGTNIIPETDLNEFYYKYKVKRSGGIKIYSNSAQEVSVYTKCPASYYESVAKGRNLVNVSGIRAGEELYIRWDTQNGGNLQWQLVEEGGNCEMALNGVLGSNMVPPFGTESYWYKFTMPSDGGLQLTNQKEIPINIYKGNCKELIKIGSGNGIARASLLKEGQTCFIELASSETDPYEVYFTYLEAQHINFEDVKDAPLSLEKIYLKAITSSGLPVNFEVLSGQATIQDNVLQAHAAGPVSIKASQAGNNDFDVAGDVIQNFCINPNTPLISISNNADAIIGVTLMSGSDEGNVWFKNGIQIEGATAPAFTPTEGGSYTVKVSLDGCASEMSEAFAVTGIADKSIFNASKVYPNPASSILVVESQFELPVPGTSVSIINAQGSSFNVPYEISLFNGKQVVLATVNDLPPGFYIIIIQSREKLTRAKFQKM